MIDKFGIYDSFLKREECNSIVEKCLQEKDLENGAIFKNGQFRVDESVRKSRVSFHSYTPDYEWLLQRIYKSINETLLVKGFDYNLDVNFQFTHYGTGEHYGWHADAGQETTDRFCSIVIQLSDNYKGGLLQFKNNGIQTFKPGIGNMFVFPSYWSHQVTPVEDGERFSLVSWFSIKRQKEGSISLL